MLRINGKKVGDVVEVTFVKSFFGVQAQERINGRLVLLEASYRAQPGDCCRVKILAERHWNTVLVGIESIVYKGDGKQSTLQHILDQIKGCPYGYGAMFQGWIFVLLNAVFPKDKERLLECLLDVLEHYKLEDQSDKPTIEYALFAREISRLIAGLPVSKLSKAKYCLRAADYCSGRREGLRAALEMALQAFSYCDEPSSLNLIALAEVHRLRAIGDEDLELQLADSKKGGSQFLLRLVLADLKLNSGSADDGRAVMALIEPVYDELRWTEYFPEVARLLSRAFHQLGHEPEAEFWLRLSKNQDAHKRLITSLDPLIEVYMRMSPELKRRVFNNASSGR